MIEAASHQLKGSATFAHLSTLSKLRRSAPADSADRAALYRRDTDTAVAYDAVLPLLGGGGDDARLEEVLSFFDEARAVPVLLSMLVLLLASSSSTDADASSGGADAVAVAAPRRDS